MQAGLYLSGIGPVLGTGRHHVPCRAPQQQPHFVAEALPARNAGPASTSEPCWLQGRTPVHSRRRQSLQRILRRAVEEQQIAAAGMPASNGVHHPQQHSQTPHSLSQELSEDVAYDGIIAEVPPKPSSLYVRVRNMVKHFNAGSGVFKAVDGVDVDIEPSTIVALLGPSGSGKTTLLRLVAGLEMPTAGKILFDDFDATNTPVQDRQIGFVFQNYALFNHKTVAENIRFGLEVRKLKIDHNQRVNDLLELVQLEGLGDRFPKQLSGGQRQRVALARSLASNPKLLLLDEPFGALDAVVRKTLRAGLKEIVRSVGVTTIIVTHDQEEAFDLADKVVIFNRGRIEQQGSPEDIIKKPRTPFIMKFVGDTNIVPATSQLLRKANFTTHKPWAMFRPSDMQLSSTLCDASAPAQVSERHNLGWIIKYHLKFDDEVEIMYNVTRDQDEKQYNLHVGQRVYVRLPASALMGFEPHEIESAPITS